MFLMAIDMTEVILITTALRGSKEILGGVSVRCEHEVIYNEQPDRL